MSSWHIIGDLESLAEGAVDEVYAAVKAAIAPYEPEVELILHQIEKPAAAPPVPEAPVAEPPKVEVAPAKIGAPISV
jgi:hypothetical protein